MRTAAGRLQCHRTPGCRQCERLMAQETKLGKLPVTRPVFLNWQLWNGKGHRRGFDVYIDIRYLLKIERLLNSYGIAVSLQYSRWSYALRACKHLFSGRRESVAEGETPRWVGNQGADGVGARGCACKWHCDGP